MIDHANQLKPAPQVCQTKRYKYRTFEFVRIKSASGCCCRVVVQLKHDKASTELQGGHAISNLKDHAHTRGQDGKSTYQISEGLQYQTLANRAAKLPGRGGSGGDQESKGFLQRHQPGLGLNSWQGHYEATRRLGA